jgi:predicted O-methyltransferase YrrM
LPSSRSFRHWTPRYLVNRLRERVYQRAHPDQPWLTPQAIQILDGWLRSSDKGLEFGSGRSTLWFASRLSQLTSVEHDPAWYGRVSGMISSEGLQNATCLLCSLEPEIEGGIPPYLRMLDRFGENSLDFILIDGRLRDECANAVLTKLRPGGLLVLDNADVYLPSTVRTPNARSHQQGPESPGWAQFLESIRSWRNVWTCNGIFATALFFKPCLIQDN